MKTIKIETCIEVSSIKDELAEEYTNKCHDAIACPLNGTLVKCPFDGDSGAICKMITKEAWLEALT